MIWFSSDLHFHHRNILAFTNRPFVSLEEMEAHYIAEWQRLVKPGDTVHFLGDFSLGKRAEIADVFAKLPGDKLLTIGNHDHKDTRRLPWGSQEYLRQIHVNSRKIVLCHYPMLTWPNAHHGAWHLHGHSHGTIPDGGTTRLDVGPDSTGRVLTSMDEIAATMAGRSYKAVDHHRPREEAAEVRSSPLRVGSCEVSRSVSK